MTDQPQPNDDALADWMRMAIPLKNADTQAQTALEETEQALGALWDRAEATGDEDAKNAITVTWQNAQRKRELVRQADAALTGAAAVMGSLVKQRSEAVRELNSLVQAIENADTLDPRLRSLVEAVEEETVLYMEEACYEDAMEQAMDVQYDNLFEEFRANVSEATGIHWTDLRTFMEWLTGRHGQLNSIQVGLFKSFISALNATIEQEVARV